MGKRKRRELAHRQESLHEQQQGPGRPATSTEFYSVRASSFSGPLPPPDILTRYNDVFPGCAERIFEMAEKNAVHRQALEKRVVDANCRAQTVGQWMAFLVTLMVVGVGGGLLLMGRDLQGFGAILSALATLAGMFVYGRRRQEQERAEKLRPMLPAHAEQQRRQR